MAQLNQFVNDAGDSVTLPNNPTDRHSPNALARVTPKYSRGDALDAYPTWQVGNVGICEETRFTSILGGSASWTGGTYLLFTDGTTDGYIWFTFNGVGADPAPGILTDLGKINVGTNDSPRNMANKLYGTLRSLSNTIVDLVGDDSVNVRNKIPGATTDATAGTLTGSVITVTVAQQGVAPDATAWDGTYTDIDGAQNLTYNDE